MDEVNSVAYSPDGRWLLSGNSDKTARVWDAVTGQPSRVLPTHNSVVQAVAFSPDRKWIASTSYDENIRLWDAVTGQLMHTLTGHADRVEFITFGPDGRWLASGADDTMIKIWEVSTGKEFRTLSGHSGFVLAWRSALVDYASLGQSGWDSMVLGSCDWTSRSYCDQ